MYFLDVRESVVCVVFEARGYWKLFSKGIISSKFWKSAASFLCLRFLGFQGACS